MELCSSWIKTPYISLIKIALIPLKEASFLKNIFVLHGITDSENIKAALANDLAKDIVIVGGGKIGVETAEALTVSGARVTIVEREPEILPFLDREMAALVRKYLEQKGIRVYTGVVVEEFHGEGKVQSVSLAGLTLPSDVVILSTGFRPNVKLAQESGLKIGETGGDSSLGAHSDNFFHGTCCDSSFP